MLKEGRFRLDSRIKLFTVRMEKHWNWVPRDAPSLQMFMTRFDGTLE